MSRGFNLGSIVGMFAYDSITLTRTPLTYVAGVATAGSPTTTPARASVQPVVGLDLQRLSEAQRTSGGVTVYSATELRLRDAFTWHGVGWTIIHVDQWDGSGYWRAVAVQTGAV